MKKNKFLSIFLITVILFGLITVPIIAEDNIKVVLNGIELAFDVPPQIINDRTMVPMRKIFEALDAEVEWDDATKTVTATKDGIVIIMQINNVVVSVDGEEITLDVPPQIVDSRTLVPIRAVAEGLDAVVEWDGKAKTVIITKEEEPEPTIAPTPTAEAVNKLSDGEYHYYELSDNDMKKLKDSYNDLLKIFEKDKLSELKNDTDFAKGIKEKSVTSEKLVKDVWNKIVTSFIMVLQMSSDDVYVVDGDPNLMQKIIEIA